MPHDTDATAPQLVINRGASRVRDPERRRAFIDVVAAAVTARIGRAPTIVDDTQEAAGSALEALIGAPLVAVVGGDGTVRHAAGILAGRSIPLAIVPAGTGNALAASLGIRGLRSAVSAIRDGGPRTIDLGLAEWGRDGQATADGSGPFVVAAGTGLDARIMATAHEEWKRRLRFGAYVGATLREMLRLAPVDLVITADGETFERHGHLVLVANTGEIIPGLVGPRRPIDPADGQLDLLVVAGRGLPGGLRSAADLLLRTGDLGGDTIRRTVREVRIVSNPAQPVEIDGDVHAPGWLAARVAPGGMTVLVPPRRTG
ncbi:MAG TPA: diacylglycerol kinase family protein [Candidatus Limnocylindrales bacterium]|nr:diacylglycerol kinase family protein [Candidatus Limnocylindrales bacterium]